jgi:hypothetical protein
MRNRKLFGAVTQRVEQYRFTILVATIWNDRLKAGLRTENEQEPNARRDYIYPCRVSAKTLAGSFERRNTSANAGAEYIGKAGSNPASWLAVKRWL